MLVLTRKNLESVVVCGTVGFEKMLQITVLEIAGNQVRLGFQIDQGVAVNRWEAWLKHQMAGPRLPQPAAPAPVAGR